MGPAPLDTIRAKLSARNPETRVAALLHAAAHGAGAVSLAADVARLVGDPHPAVSWHAVHAFRAVGAGAADAVPVLLALRDALAAPDLVRQRVAACLGSIGPAAKEAIAPLKTELWDGSEHVLGALLSIAPDDPEVVDAQVQAVFSESAALSRVAREALVRARNGAIDRVTAEALARASSEDAADRLSAARVMLDLASLRPRETQDALRKLLARPGSKEVWPALGAVAALPRPVPQDLVAAVVEIARQDQAARGRALEVLATLGADARQARDALIEIIEASKDAIPLPGPEGAPARHLAAAARALAAAAPSAKEAIAPLLVWLDSAPRRDAERLSWTPVGDVACAVAKMAPSAPKVGRSIVDALRASRLSLDEGEAGMKEFERRIRQALDALADPTWWTRAEELGLTRAEPEAAETRSLDPGASALPDFPEEGEGEADAPRAPRIKDLDPHEAWLLRERIEAGRSLLGGITRDSPPLAIAQAVDRHLQQRRGEQRAATYGEVLALGAVYGDAVQRAVGWRWAQHTKGGEVDVALISPDAANALLPVPYIARQLDPRQELTALLVFTMLAGGTLPPAPSGALSIIG